MLTTIGFGEEPQQQPHFRFPPPDFESGYKLPTTTTPPPRVLTLEYLDVAVLLVTLGIAAWLVHKNRKRTGVVALSIFSVLYFGFYREGCICAIGSVQNVTLALFDHTYAVPLTAMVFFFAPLVVALFAGRAFCSSVCPHGALQDLVLMKPVKVPSWLEHALGVLPYIYLGAGVLFAATGSAFVICRYDPFVPLFRMTGSFHMLALGAAFLLVGVFVGRPYCRFLCPYGVLLKLASTVSKWRVRVTPDYCTQCQLCQHSCPYGAMRQPVPVTADAPTLARDRKRLAGLLLLVPVLVAALGWLGSLLSTSASKLNPTVALAEHYATNVKQPQTYGLQSPEALRLKRAEKEPQELLTNATAIRKEFVLSGWLLGGWIGLVIGVKLVSLSVRRARTDFEPDRGACFACARCFEYCPNELVRRGVMPASALPVPVSLPQAQS